MRALCLPSMQLTMAQQSLPSVIDTFISQQQQPGQDDPVPLNTLVINLHKGIWTLPQVIEQNTALANHDDDVKRSRATLLLSELLNRLPGMRLDNLQTEQLLNFFKQRLEDKPCIKEVLMGIFALFKYQTSNISELQSWLFLDALFSIVKTQSLSQSGRKSVFDIVQLMSQNYPSVLVSNADVFIKHFLSAMDGEKDPRNLLVVFSVIIFILGSMRAAASAHIEQIFEVTSCYFPITFIAPRSDPTGVTGEDLRKLLRAILGMHSGMAKHVYPLLLEKIEASETNVKIDTLETMTFCLQHYSTEASIPFVPAIAAEVRRELQDAVNDSVTLAATDTLREITRLVCPDYNYGCSSVNVSPLWDAVFLPWLTETSQELSIPDTKIARQLSHISVLIMSFTANAFFRVWANLFPHIKSKFISEHCQPLQRLALLELLNNVAKKAHGPFAVPILNHPLSPYVNELIDMLYSTLLAKEPYLRASAISCITSVIAVTSSDRALTSMSNSVLFVDDEALQLATNTAAKLFFGDEDAAVRKAALTSLVALAPVNEQKVVDKVLPQFFQHSAFKKQSDQNASIGNVHEFEILMNAITSLAAVSKLALHSVIPKLVDLVHDQLQTALAGTTNSIQLIVIALRSLSDVLSTLSAANDGRERISLISVSLATSIFNMLLDAAVEVSRHDTTQQLDTEIIDRSAVIIRVLVRSADVDTQRELFAKCNGMFFDSERSITGVVSFHPFSADVGIAQRQLVIIYCSLFTSLRPAVLFPLSEAVHNALLNMACSVSIAHSVILDAQRSSQIALASYVNKMPNANVDQYCNDVVQGQLLRSARNSDLDAKHRIVAVHCFSWMLKGLLMRGYKAVQPLISDLCCLLQLNGVEYDIANAAAKSFHSLLEDSDLLSKASFATLAGALYKQRLFAQAFPLLLAQFEEVHPPRNSTTPVDESLYSSPVALAHKHVLFVALISLLRHVPKSVLVSHMGTALPLVIQSLHDEDPIIKSEALVTLMKIVQDDASLLRPYLNTMLSMLTKLSQFHGPLQIRLAALLLLDKLAGLPRSVLYPYRDDVVATLVPALDDRKRIVRETAARCRNHWFLLDGPSH